MKTNGVLQLACIAPEAIAAISTPEKVLYLNMASGQLPLCTQLIFIFIETNKVYACIKINYMYWKMWHCLPLPVEAATVLLPPKI